MKQSQCKWFHVCPMKYYWEQGQIESKWIENYCNKNWLNCIRYEKEENGIEHPDQMLPNGEIDENLY
ncbi:MAG: uracil-DNA glycosylase [Bacteroidota bacterium]|nr:uracil-DNA glycosylase [Bacteroidota bacterium]